MPQGNRTGPVGQGSRDGRGRKSGGRGQSSSRQGQGKKTGGRKGGC